MLHKKIGFLWGALAVGVFLSGCGSKSPLDPKNPVAIDVWTYYNGDQLSAFDSLVEDFNATVGREKGIVVKGVMAHGELAEELHLKHASGPPIMILSWNPWQMPRLLWQSTLKERLYILM